MLSWYAKEVHGTSKFLTWAIVSLILFIVSVLQVGPRILHHPDPMDETRLQHHLGDGSSDAGLLFAHEYWQAHGMLSTKLVPCLNLKPSGECVPYTHYPPVLYLFSSLLLSFFKNLASPVNSLILTRMVIYLLGVGAISFALVQLMQVWPRPRAIFFALSALIGLLPGFVIYADNLFGHGIALALQFLCFSHVLSRPKAERVDCVVFFGLSTLIFWWNLEPLPFFLLVPLLILFQNKNSTAAVFRFFLVALLAFCLSGGLRIAQNAWVLGGFDLLLEDWQKILSQRVAGARPGILEFALEQFRYQRIMITKWGQVWLFSSMAGLLFHSRKRGGFLIAVYLMALSWNFIFVEHSMIHLFTAKAVLIPFARSVLFVSAAVWERVSHNPSPPASLR